MIGASVSQPKSRNRKQSKLGLTLLCVGLYLFYEAYAFGSHFGPSSGYLWCPLVFLLLYAARITGSQPESVFMPMAFIFVAGPILILIGTILLITEK